MKTYAFEIEPFGRAFVENRRKSMAERVGAGMKEAVKYLPISFPENCMLPTVGVTAVNGAFFLFTEAASALTEHAFHSFWRNSPNIRMI